MREQKQLHQGFSLIELVIVMAILVVLAGIVYAATGPSREKARQSACMSNLHQLGIAINLYRNDYDGGDSGSTVADWGLPPSIYLVAPYTGNNQSVFHCPDVPPAEVTNWEIRNHGGLWTDYSYDIWPNGSAQEASDGPWADAITQRGSSFPIMGCYRHDFPPPDRPPNMEFVILVRLDSSVSAGYHARFGDPSWKW